MKRSLGFWGWLKWNYQGRYDLSYTGPFHDVYMFGRRFQMPFEKRHCVIFSRRLERDLGWLRTSFNRRESMDEDVWTRMD